ncbi:MAG: hypothetical protein LBS16_07835 [Prevotellaceae bacterium]|jgi:hypothetical protein|nr:hypothetical protein [Prevotellaceae bacterium]
MENLKNLSYEELCEKLHKKEIGYLTFVKSQDEELAALYSGTMTFYGFPENDTTAEAWLENHEKTLGDMATAEECLPVL